MDSTPPAQAPQASVADVQFLFHVLKNVKGKLEVNWDSVATAQKLKNATVAKVRFGQIKKKLKWDGDQSSTGPTSSQVSPLKPVSAKRGRGGKAVTKEHDQGTPVKKRKTASAKVEIHEDKMEAQEDMKTEFWDSELEMIEEYPDADD